MIRFIWEYRKRLRDMYVFDDGMELVEVMVFSERYRASDMWIDRADSPGQGKVI